MTKNRSKKISETFIEDVHSSGKTICRYKGLNIFIPFAIPGERADIVIDSYKPFAKGRIINITEPSVSRAIPFCPYFNICGGCNWQHIKYEYQLQLKKKILINALKKYDIPLPEVPDVIASPAIKEYRFKMEHSFSSSRWFYENEGEINDPDKRCALGFHLTDKPDRVVDVEKCEMQKPFISEIVREIKEIALKQNLLFYNYRDKSGFLKSLITRVSSNDEIMISLIFAYEDKEKQNHLLKEIQKRHDKISSLNFAVLEEPSQTIPTNNFISLNNSSLYISEKVNRLSFRIGPSTFYQPNAAQAEKIYSKICEISALKGDENIYDLYCGAGTISLHLARYAKHVTGIEGSCEATDLAKQNSITNKIPNAAFINGDVLQTFNSDFIRTHGKPDIIVLDPPRSGTLIEIKKTILNAEPEKIVYLSCNPLSLAHDLKMLCEKYKISYVQPYDMMPHTHQLETLVVLEK